MAGVVRYARPFMVTGPIDYSNSQEQANESLAHAQAGEYITGFAIQQNITTIPRKPD